MTRVRDSIRIDAEPDAVLRVLLDVHGYARWQQEVDHVDLLENDDAGRPLQTRVWIKALGRTGSYTVAYDYPADNVLRYHLLEGDMMSRHDAEFTVARRGRQAELSVHLDLALKWPVPAALVAVFARKGVNQMLTSVKELAEAG